MKFKIGKNGDLKAIISALDDIIESPIFPTQDFKATSDVKIRKSGALLEAALLELAKEMQTLYDQGRDPYGKKWKPRKHQYSHPILNKTGKVKSSFEVEARNNSLSFINKAPYSGYVHEGTQNMPARNIVPTEERGVPRSWRIIIQKAAIEAISERLKKRKR